jgi:hypothetical protein
MRGDTQSGANVASRETSWPNKPALQDSFPDPLFVSPLIQKEPNKGKGVVDNPLTTKAIKLGRPPNPTEFFRTKMDRMDRILEALRSVFAEFEAYSS